MLFRSSGNVLVELEMTVTGVGVVGGVTTGGTIGTTGCSVTGGVTSVGILGAVTVTSGICVVGPAIVSPAPVVGTSDGVTVGGTTGGRIGTLGVVCTGGVTGVSTGGVTGTVGLSGATC